MKFLYLWSNGEEDEDIFINIEEIKTLKIYEKVYVEIDTKDFKKYYGIVACEPDSVACGFFKDFLSNKEILPKLCMVSVSGYEFFSNIEKTRQESMQDCE